MEIYRLKHKVTGLYFNPRRKSLSEVGKLYSTNSNYLNYYSGLDYVEVKISKKKSVSILESHGYQPDFFMGQTFLYRIPKSEFEREYLK